MASTIVETLSNAAGFQLIYNDNWVCTTQVGDDLNLETQETRFESYSGE
jgi:hypothetical protein